MFFRKECKQLETELANLRDRYISLHESAALIERERRQLQKQCDRANVTIAWLRYSYADRLDLIGTYQEWLTQLPAATTSIHANSDYNRIPFIQGAAYEYLTECFAETKRLIKERKPNMTFHLLYENDETLQHLRTVRAYFYIEIPDSLAAFL